MPQRQLVPVTVNASCPRSKELSLENAARDLPHFDNEPADQLIPVAALVELGDLNVDDIVHEDNADHAGEADAPGRLLES